MARIPREFLIFPGLAFHKIWRGHNKEWNLSSPSEKTIYLSFLRQTLPSSTQLFAFCLMSNHSHEIFQTQNISVFSHFMRRHHMRYGIFFNRTHNRQGKVAQDRPMTCSIQNENQEMILSFYIHANPLRAKIVKQAKDYPWSTFRWYAFGKPIKSLPFLKFPNWYLKLGRTWKERQKKYRKLFDAYLREQGLIKQSFSHYGFGNFFWWQEKRTAILNQMKNRYPPIS